MENIGLTGFGELNILLAIVVAYVIAYLSIPSIVTVAREKKLIDKPNHRTSHYKDVPTLGGIAIFAALIVSQCIFINVGGCADLKYIIAGMVLVFFIGLKDDILAIAALKKLIMQIAAALIVSVLGNIRLTNLHGFLGITEIPYITSIILTVFVIIVILNSVNLIDGIDGLASGVSILTSVVFGIWFYLVGAIDYAIICATIVGSCSGFFIFNVFGNKNKIFMGDTGSLILGFYLAILAIKFNEINVYYNGIYKIYAAPAVSIGIMVVPLFDTLRVFILRAASGKSPFVADKNHVHHSLIDLGFSHLKATLYILGANVVFIIISFLIFRRGIFNVTIVILVLAILASYIPTHFLRKRGIIKDRTDSNISAG
jgi:UDP-GlcNAc:undecaprenyl-phosphate/decaprenyl-phosphate GlcNAc-1-phosphate transferase